MLQTNLICIFTLQCLGQCAAQLLGFSSKSASSASFSLVFLCPLSLNFGYHQLGKFTYAKYARIFLLRFPRELRSSASLRIFFLLFRAPLTSYCKRIYTASFCPANPRAVHLVAPRGSFRTEIINSKNSRTPSTLEFLSFDFPAN